MSASSSELTALVVNQKGIVTEVLHDGMKLTTIGGRGAGDACESHAFRAIIVDRGTREAPDVPRDPSFDCSDRRNQVCRKED